MVYINFLWTINTVLYFAFIWVLKTSLKLVFSKCRVAAVKSIRVLHHSAVFGSIVYNRSLINIHRYFLNVDVHVIIIEPWNQTAHLYEIQVTVIYSRAILVTVMSEYQVKRVICKTWTGTLANSADSDQTPLNAAFNQGQQYVLKLQEVND